ncbi:MAG: DUF3276 family protein [Bacteroidales bacterium]|nr:DUF3276 family protein [Bacteroidales bacterium]
MENREERINNEVYSKSLKAGKRTYFFDVKKTKNDEKYLVITESKKVFNQQDGSFDYDKHKIFLYKEDYTKFSRMLENMIEYIKTGIPLKEEVDMQRNRYESTEDNLTY